MRSLFLVLCLLLMGCGKPCDLEQAYIEGYRVGWAHGIENRPAQLGDDANLHYIGIGKECLYLDFFDVQRQLKIFKNGRSCEGWIKPIPDSFPPDSLPEVKK